MILAFDSYYFNNQAKTVCLAFKDWNAAEEAHVFSEILSGVKAYQPGAFYKRELPGILSLFKKLVLSDIEAIVIDGFVYLDDSHAFGLGGHLYEALHKKIPVIGVAKTNFATVQKLKCPVTRGNSKNPLYITAAGMDVKVAGENIRRMHGDHRLPTLLKRLDFFTRQPG